MANLSKSTLTLATLMATPIDGTLQPKTLELIAEARRTDRRVDVIAAIKAALKDRSGRAWSVTGGRGTAWGWLRISALPAHLNCGHSEWETDPSHFCNFERHSMSQHQRTWLGKLLGLQSPVHHQGESIASGGAYWLEYVDRAAGVEPTHRGVQYWD